MGSLSRRSYGYAVIAVAVIAFVAITVMSNVWLRTARIDLTEGGLYTVSEGTRATLARLEEPITLRFFFSRRLTTGYPTVTAYAGRVRDLLQEYASLGRGRIILEEIDPEPFTPAEDQAVAAGLTGAPTQQGDAVYFGLVGTNALDGREVIPFFNADRENYLEYDLTSLIHRLATPQRPMLGILSTLPLESGVGGMLAMLQGTAQPLAIYQQLREVFEVLTIERDTDRIPADISTLLVVHPADLADRTLYAIDQFVLGGGHAIVFVDPLSEIAGAVSEGMGGPGVDASSEMATLFAAWGIEYDPSKVVGDVALAQRVRFGSELRPETLSYIVWLRLTPEHFDSGDPVVGDLNQLNLATVGALRPLPDAQTQFAPLITSSVDAGLLDAVQVRVTRNPADLLRSFQPEGERFTVAARISGPARSAFPEGPPPTDEEVSAEDGDGAPLAAPLTEAQNINVIVVADTDLLDDRFWVEAQTILGQRIYLPIADNGAFVINAIENMMGSSELISLRTRAPPRRTFTVVEELRRDAETRFLAEEQRLQERLVQTEAQLRALEGGAESEALGASRPEALSTGEQVAIENFRRELVETRASLREVQANLRRDVEALGDRLAFINIALVPLLVAAAAIGLALLRRRRRLQARGM